MKIDPDPPPVRHKAPSPPFTNPTHPFVILRGGMTEELHTGRSREKDPKKMDRGGLKDQNKKNSSRTLKRKLHQSCDIKGGRGAALPRFMKDFLYFAFSKRNKTGEGRAPVGQATTKTYCERREAVAEIEQRAESVRY